MFPDGTEGSLGPENGAWADAAIEIQEIRIVKNALMSVELVFILLRWGFNTSLLRNISPKVYFISPIITTFNHRIINYISVIYEIYLNMCNIIVTTIIL